MLLTLKLARKLAHTQQVILMLKMFVGDEIVVLIGFGFLPTGDKRHDK